MSYLWTNIISPVFRLLAEVWQWLTSGSTASVATWAALALVVVVLLARRRR